MARSESRGRRTSSRCRCRERTAVPGVQSDQITAFTALRVVNVDGPEFGMNFCISRQPPPPPPLGPGAAAGVPFRYSVYIFADDAFEHSSAIRWRVASGKGF
jgi:hypothetical protein